MRITALLAVVAATLLIQQPRPAGAQATSIQFKEQYSEAKVTVAFAGRLVRTYSGANGDVLREFVNPSASRGGGLFLLHI